MSRDPSHNFVNIETLIKKCFKNNNTLTIQQVRESRIDADTVTRVTSMQFGLRLINQITLSKNTWTHRARKKHFEAFKIITKSLRTLRGGGEFLIFLQC